MRAKQRRWYGPATAAESTLWSIRPHHRLIIEAGGRDPIFPIAAARAAHMDLVGLWNALGTVENESPAVDVRAPELIVTDAGHQFLADPAISTLTTYFDDLSQSPSTETACSPDRANP